jgi:ribosomal protein S18 acetylase RimI-like enzyme
MGRLRVRPLRRPDVARALAYLEREPRLNLVLIDLVLRLGGEPPGGEPRPAVLAALRGEEIAGLAAVRPSTVLDATADPEALEALLPHLGSLGSGLVKSTESVVAPLWRWLEAHGRRALLDRIEIGYALEPPAPEVEPPGDARVRRARRGDLEALVEAARASLREENRPDAFRGDPLGFRRWVDSRIPRATIVEAAGRVVFVGYADVQCPRGWLLQGVYTWPSWRRRGVARAGVAALCRQAFAEGADHVQLAVVESNRAAERLYESLGFRAFGRVRTLLFA